MKRLFYDLETTGLKPDVNGIHQLAGFIEIDGEIVHRFDIRMNPQDSVVIEQKALDVSGTTMEQLEGFVSSENAYSAFIRILKVHVDKFNKHDKFHLVGYNNRSFDDLFLRSWFYRNGDKYFGSWFWADSIDVLVLASNYLQDVRHTMTNFKLMTVAAQCGIDVDESKLHDGLYDIEITHEMYNIINGK